VYVARDCQRNGTRSDDPGERIYPELVSFEEFVSMSQLPGFRNGEMKRRVAAMLYAQNHEEELEAFRRVLFD
jgi:hypothetical protein